MTSIQGTLLMCDDTTPHVAVHVQAIRDGEVVGNTLSDEKGNYQFTDLQPGRYQVRCYTLNGYIYFQNGATLRVERGKPLSNIDFRLAPFKRGTWKTYTT